MRPLNLFSFTAALMLLTACHSTDVALRHSRIRTCISEELQTKDSPKEIIEIQPTATNTETAEASTLVQASETNSFLAPSKKLLLPNQGVPIASKHHAHNLNNTTPKKTAVSAKSNVQILEKHGIVGQISYSFGVVGLVFIIIGIVLLLIGGLIIDTLAALAIAFGFVFILIWLVLAILQGLFDVIL